MIKRADLKYLSKKIDEAIIEYETFVRTNTSSEFVPYALYRLACIYYEMIALVARDQTDAIKAMQYCNILLENYPNSEYISDVKRMIRDIEDIMSAKELYVAKEYEKRKNYPAALNRLGTIVQKYSDAKVTEEALFRMIECYIAINAIDEAKNINKIMQRDYPNGYWSIQAIKLLKKYTK